MLKNIIIYIWGSPYMSHTFDSFEEVYYQAQFEAERMGYPYSKYWVW